MKRQIYSELGFLLATLIVSIGIVLLLFGTSSLSSNNLDIQIHDTYLILTTSLVLGQLWLIMYFLTNTIRQLFLKFYNVLLNITLILTSGLLCYFFYGYIGLLNDPGMTFNENSATLYPPLSGIPQTVSHNNSTVELFKTVLWSVEILLLTVFMLTTIMTIVRRKGNRA